MHKSLINFLYWVDACHKKIPKYKNQFTRYLSINAILDERLLAEDESKDAFFSMNSHKSLIFNFISENVLKQVHHIIQNLFTHNFSLNIGILYYKTKKDKLTIYKPISVLPCISNIIERIIFLKRMYHYFDQNAYFSKNNLVTERAILLIMQNLN